MQYQKPVIIQEQRLKMNPQLYQSIQLMALPLQELKFKIQEELERNPALEVIEDNSELSLEEATPKETREVEEYFENSSDPGFTRNQGREASDNKQQFLEGALTRPESLQDHLIWQLQLEPVSEQERKIGELLIHNLDEHGFHKEKPITLLKNRDHLAIMENMMRKIQRYEPVGTCTANYREALIVQSQVSPDAPEGTEVIIREYLDLFEKRKFKEIARHMAMTVEKVEEILGFIQTLEPFPGREYSLENARYVIPDLMVRIQDGDVFIILNDEEIPVLGISPFFNQVAKDEEQIQEKQARQFAKTTVKDARWFIRSIKQRNNTLLRISKAIVEFQRDFFLRGPKYIVPLTLKDIANTVDVHETTVSRISNAKYVQTEWGIYELKYFFSNSISGAGSSGSRFSKEGVKQVIKEIIEEEKSHLSDQKIADILEKKGIKLARRTVAKYRKELDISSSYDR